MDGVEYGGDRTTDECELKKGAACTQGHFQKERTETSENGEFLSFFLPF